MSQYHEIRLLFGDQLNAKHSWFNEKQDGCLYVLAELHQKAQYTKHHVQKICAFFDAMNHFAQALQKAGHECLYLNLDDTQAYSSLVHLIHSLVEKYSAKVFSYQLPDEYRLRDQLADLQIEGCKVLAYSTEHFYLDESEFGQYFHKDKHNRMESFYRKMRKRYSVLMDGDSPLGGDWNYDQKNRNTLKKSDLEAIPTQMPIEQLNTVLCHKGYMTPVFEGRHALGSTYVKNDLSTDVRGDETEMNLATHEQALANTDIVQALQHDGKARAATRLGSPDHQPVVGALHNFDSLKELYTMLGVGKPLTSAPVLPSSVVSTLTCLGSRGLTTAPLMAEVLVSSLCKEPLPLSNDLLNAVNTSRFMTREAIRSQG